MSLLLIYFDLVIFEIVYDNTSCKLAKPDARTEAPPGFSAQNVTIKFETKRAAD